MSVSIRSSRAEPIPSSRSSRSSKQAAATATAAVAATAAESAAAPGAAPAATGGSDQPQAPHEHPQMTNRHLARRWERFAKCLFDSPLIVGLLS